MAAASISDNVVSRLVVSIWEGELFSAYIRRRMRSRCLLRYVLPLKIKQRTQNL